MTEEYHDHSFSTPAPFRLGTWQVQPDRNQLLQGDRVVQLEPRLMQVLVYLAGRPGEVVPRRQLRIAVWGDTIVGEDSLNRAISDLRQALGDDTSTPRYIETIRKVGYRLVAPVTSAAQEGSDEVDVRDPIDAGGVPTPASARRLAGLWRPALALLCIAAVVVIVNENRRRTGLVTPEPPVPLTREPGLEVRPALSPDGTRVAFAKKTREGNQADIFVCQRHADSPRQITFYAGYENYPTWSPDGSWLAFVRCMDESSGIFTVPAIGGEPRRVYSTEGLPRHLDWSPNGRWIVFSESYGEGHARLLLLDLQPDERTPQVLTRPIPGEESDTFPRFSPSGNEVAFIRTARSGLSDVFCVGIADGEVRRLTSGQISIWGLDWHPDGDEIYVSSFAGGPFALSAVSLREGTVRRSRILTEWARYPSLAREATCLAFESRRESQDIMIMPLCNSGVSGTTAEPLVASNVLDCEPSWSPDGAKIAFISTRSGHRELWTCDSKGSHLQQLTRLAGPYVDCPVWSPNGQRLAFMAAGANTAVYVIDSLGGAPHRITPADHDAMLCSWSRDGKRVYYACDAGGAWQIWQVDPEGGNPTQLSTDGGIAAIESIDGETLYVVRPDQTGIWRRTVDGDTLECVVPDLPASHFQSWVVTAEGVYFVRPKDVATTVMLYDPRSGDTSEVAEIPSYPTTRFSVSPDGRSLLFVRSDRLDIDLELIDYLP